MDSMTTLIRTRRSVRTFDPRPLSKEHLALLDSYSKQITNPYGIWVPIRLLSSAEHHLSSPVISGGDWYAGACVPFIPDSDEAFGYAFEAFLLYALSLGIGSVFLGGTMDRGLFEKAIGKGPEEKMPCVSPLGYISKKMSLREAMMRKGVKADSRLSFEELFFDGSPATPLTKEMAGVLTEPLEMVRLAPSAVNKQPWRVIRSGDLVHFYRKPSKGFTDGPAGNMQKVDMGIALCHFALTAEELGLTLDFLQKDPGLTDGSDLIYTASYRIRS